MKRKRKISERVRLKDLHGSIYVVSEEEYVPTHVTTENGKKIYRVKLVATVVSDPFFSEDGTYARIQLDDSTETIMATAFRDKISLLKDLKRGDIVQAVSKVNEWRGEKGLVLEALSKVHPNFILLHRLELLKSDKEHRAELEKAREIFESEGNLRRKKERAQELGVNTKVIEALDEYRYLSERREEEAPKEVQLKSRVLETVERLDHGKGAELDALIIELSKDFSSEEIEEALRELLGSGEIYEPEINKYSRVK
ncbi:MAG: replication protein RepA [Candidatus Methanofastidiosia archaeon]